ncbi:MAG: AraC family transcriptional regulator [Chitinophagaceae bacterium]|nr:MAG: AraC family transcriptional regulator [Chitinophagaceae bacterium]
MEAILRKVEKGYNYSFCIREDIGPYIYKYWHFHPEAEITLVRKGVGVRLIGDNVEPFKDGDLVLLGGNIPHLWRSAPEYFQGNKDLHIEAVVVQFMEDFWGNVFMELPEMSGVKDLLKLAKRGIKVIGKTKERMTIMMEDMLRTRNIRRVTLLLEMIQLIAASGEYQLLSSVGFVGGSNEEYLYNINKIYDYTLEHFQEEIDIPKLASIINISPSSFCRYYKMRTMKTYWQFLLEVRIGYACKLLIENKMNISQICLSCGFNNLSNFNRRFKSITGLTPSHYLKEHK